MRALGGLIALLLVLGGCAPPDAVNKERQGTDARTVKGRLTVKASGTVSVDFDAQVDLRIVTILPHEKKLRLLSVGIVQMENLSRSERFKVAFDLVGVYAGKPGRFTIPAAKSEVPTITATPVTEDDPLGFSNALLTFFKLKDPSAPVSLDNLEKGHEFNVALEPCELEVEGELEASGSLSCPKLKDPAGNIVRLNMTWKVDPKATPSRG